MNYIIHVRIDDRLIHGQVATLWTSKLNATRIMIIDDEISNDDMAKMALKLATPVGVSLSVLTVNKAVERLEEEVYKGQRVFLIVKSVETLYRLYEKGLSFPVVNLGNLRFSEGKNKITAQIALSDLEYSQLKEIHTMGTKITIQLIPSHRAEVLFES